LVIAMDVTTAYVLIGISAFALGLVVERWRQSRRTKKLESLARRLKKRRALQVELGDNYDMVSDWADTSGLPLTEWASRAVVSSVPEAVRKRARRATAGHSALDAAFAALDVSEEMQVPDNVLGFPPEPASREIEEKEVPGKIEALMHPCNHLSDQMPPNFTREQCSGLCHAPGQRGRPCFWAPNAASQCPYFRPKVHPTRVKLRATG